MLDYRGVGLERFHCISISNNSFSETPLSTPPLVHRSAKFHCTYIRVTILDGYSIYVYYASVDNNIITLTE